MLYETFRFEYRLSTSLPPLTQASLTASTTESIETPGSPGEPDYARCSIAVSRPRIDRLARPAIFLTVSCPA